MTRRESISIVFCIINVLTMQAQWTRQDSIRLNEMLNGKEELKINNEAVKAIQFDFNPDRNIEKEVESTPIASEDKPWMTESMPRNFMGSEKLNDKPSKSITPYTYDTKWNEDFLSRSLLLPQSRFKITWQWDITPDPWLMNGYVPLPAGMDQSVTPSNNPMFGSLDFGNFFYETFTEEGRSIRYNRKHANAWKTYKGYVPTKSDSIKRDSVSLKKLFLEDEVNGKH